MHVALFTETYPPIASGRGSHVRDLAEGIAHRGHRVSVLTETPAWVDGAARRAAGGIEFHEVKGLAAACTRLDPRHGLHSLRGVLESLIGVDVLHVFDDIPALMCAMLPGFLPDAVCLSLFTTTIGGRRVFGLRGGASRQADVARFITASLPVRSLVCGSERSRQRARAEGYPDEWLTVVPHATNVHDFFPDAARRIAYRHRRGWSQDFVVLLPARPIPRKRCEDLIGAMPSVRRQVTRVRAVITDPTGRGDAGYAERLRRQIRHLDLADVIEWLPGVGVGDMPDLMRAADAVAVPGSDGGLGIVLLEAMASGVPIVASDAGGHVEAFGGDCGGIYPLGDVDALAAELVSVSEGKAAERTAAALRRVRAKYGRRQLVNDHERIYTDLLLSRRDGARERMADQDSRPRVAIGPRGAV